MVETLQQPELQLVEEKIEVMLLMMEKMLIMLMMVEMMLMIMEKVLVLIVQGYNCVNANLKRAPLAFPSKMQKATFSETINRCNVQHISIMLKINLNFALYTANKFSLYVKTWQLAIFSHSFIPGSWRVESVWACAWCWLWCWTLHHRPPGCWPLGSTCQVWTEIRGDDDDVWCCWMYYAISCWTRSSKWLWLNSSGKMTMCCVL